MMGLRQVPAVLLSLFAAVTTTVAPIRFEDGRAPQFVTRTGRTARKYLPQTMGGGVAVLNEINHLQGEDRHTARREKKRQTANRKPVAVLMCPPSAGGKSCDQ